MQNHMRNRIQGREIKSCQVMGVLCLRKCGQKCRKGWKTEGLSKTGLRFVKTHELYKSCPS